MAIEDVKYPLNYPSSDSRARYNGRTPNDDLPPFVAKTQIRATVNGKTSYFQTPLYTPYDATDQIQGVTWLTDDLRIGDANLENGNKTARTGMTAMTPYGVRKNALCVTRQNGNITVEGDQNSLITFRGTVNIDNLKCQTISGTSETDPSIKVICRNAVDNTIITSGQTTGIKDSDGYFNLGLNFNKLPPNLLPDKIPSNNIEITGDMLPEIPTSKLPNIPLEKLPASVMERVTLVNSYAEMLKLGIDTIQNGDAVKINNLPGTTEEGYEGKIYVVIDDTKLGTSEAFTEFSAGTASKAARADRADLADKASAIKQAVTFDFTGDVSASATTDLSEQFVYFTTSIATIEKKTIGDIFGVTLE